MVGRVDGWVMAVYVLLRYVQFFARMPIPLTKFFCPLLLQRTTSYIIRMDGHATSGCTHVECRASSAGTCVIESYLILAHADTRHGPNADRS